MKYCVDYTPTSQVLTQVDEINIPFNKDDLLVVIDFLNNHQFPQRVNIYIKDIESMKMIDKLIRIKNENPNFNFALKLAFYDKDIVNLDKIKEAKIDFYFESYVSEWEKLLEILELGVSDVFITEELCFDLKRVSNIAHQYNVKLRVFPNVSQKSWDNMPALKSFFIRPEDVEEYSDYIDILEIYGDRKKQEIYYKIYSKDKKWFGDLGELIIGLNYSLDSRFTIPRFGEKRTTCQRKCLKGEKCKICEKIEKLSKTLEKANILVKINKEDKENG